MNHRKQFPGATPYLDCRGKRRWRYRKNGKAFELGTDYGSDDFIQRYQAAMEGAKVRGGIGADRVRPGTVNDLVARFYAVALAGDNLLEGTKASYKGIIERFREEHGDKRVEGLRVHHVETILSKKANTPNAANNLRKRLARLLDLAVKMEWLPSNPARLAKPLRVEGGGHHTWGEGEGEQFYATHAPGTMAHRAMTLMPWTGAARVDAVKLGWPNLRGTGEGRTIEYVRQKTRSSSGILVRFPIHPELDATLALCPPEAATFLVPPTGSSGAPQGWAETCATDATRRACPSVPRTGSARPPPGGLPRPEPPGLRSSPSPAMGPSGRQTPTSGT